MRIRPTSFVYVALAVVACSEATSPKSLENAEERWEASGFERYAFTTERQCFCAEEGRGPVRIVVEDDEVVSVMMVETNAPVNPEFWFTIDDLFDLIRAQIQTLPDRVDAEYDDDLGYPTRFTYGTPENDAGGVIRVWDVARITQ
jgi:hypothetical protein